MQTSNGRDPKLMQRGLKRLTRLLESQANQLDGVTYAESPELLYGVTELVIALAVIGLLLLTVEVGF